MTQTDNIFTNKIRIKAIEDQIRENQWLSSIGHSFDKSWWYSKANESLEKRILLYK